MNDKEALTQIIKKAINNGWAPFIVKHRSIGMSESLASDINDGKHISLLVGAFLNNPLLFLDIPFLKAYFNEPGNVCVYCGSLCDKCRINNFSTISYWEYYAKELVLEEDKITYLKKFL